MFERLVELEKKGEPVALAVVTGARGSVPRRAGSKMLVFPDGRIEGTIGGGEVESRVIAEALQALAKGEPRTLHYDFIDPAKGDPGVCGGEMDLYIEPIQPGPTLLVVGGGHLGRAVAHLGRWLGFRVVVSDDRAEFATPEAVPDGDEFVHCELAQLPSRTKIDRQTYVVLVTRGAPVDVAGLPALLETNAAYIGVIGSRRRFETSVKELLAMGINEDRISRLVSPIGLELNAETPEEIALSILAEVVMLRRGGTGKTMAHDALARRKRRRG